MTTQNKTTPIRAASVSERIGSLPNPHRAAPAETQLHPDLSDPELQSQTVPFAFSFTPTRREALATLGAGILIAVLADTTFGQARGGGGRGGRGGGGGGANAGDTASRIHIAPDGTLTVLVGKVEGGQGSRAELTQAAAEELGVAPSRISLIMADTAQCPDDGITAGSGTTPRTLPSVRQSAAAARALLLAAAAKQFNAKLADLTFADGVAADPASKQSLSYADLAKADDKALAQAAPLGTAVTPVKSWKVLGTPVPRPNARDIVTGAHKYPSDIAPPNTHYGKILRAPSYNAQLTSIAKLASIDTANVFKDVTVVQDRNFVGVVAPTTFLAEQALAALAKTAKWEGGSRINSADLFPDLAKRANAQPNAFAADLAKAPAGKSLKQTYNISYAQHSPMEPRAACALWEDGKLTVWTGTQNPFGVRRELTTAFRLTDAACRVIVPDFGGGFGGKHTGEAAVEAAKLAQASGKPVSLRWTRAEELTWAYFRPAAVVNIEASLDDKNNIATWYMININGGPSAVESPYTIPKSRSLTSGGDAPLRQGSYRALASTGNTFARESAMDELALLAGTDPLEFRLAHLQTPRLRAVLIEAAKRFDWPNMSKKKEPNVGVGLACGTEKGSYVAACAEIMIDKTGDKPVIKVRRVTQVFECGTVTNPANLLSQVQGAIIMGIGPALREAIEYKDGAVTTNSFFKYRVPRFADVPEIDVHFLQPEGIPSAGAGETPIIAIAPALANALAATTNQRLRTMPMRL